MKKKIFWFLSWIHWVKHNDECKLKCFKDWIFMVFQTFFSIHSFGMCIFSSESLFRLLFELVWSFFSGDYIAGKSFLFDKKKLSFASFKFCFDDPNSLLVVMTLFIIADAMLSILVSDIFLFTDIWRFLNVLLTSISLLMMGFRVW